MNDFCKVFQVFVDEYVLTMYNRNGLGTHTMKSRLPFLFVYQKLCSQVYFNHQQGGGSVVESTISGKSSPF